MLDICTKFLFRAWLSTKFDVFILLDFVKQMSFNSKKNQFAVSKEIHLLIGRSV
jgi:hypothetical protein